MENYWRPFSNLILKPAKTLNTSWLHDSIKTSDFLNEFLNFNSSDELFKILKFRGYKLFFQNFIDAWRKTENPWWLLSNLKWEHQRFPYQSFICLACVWFYVQHKQKWIRSIKIKYKILLFWIFDKIISNCIKRTYTIASFIWEILILFWRF